MFCATGMADVIYKYVGSDPYKAEIDLLRQQFELKSQAAGGNVSTEPTQSQPEPIQTSVTKTNLRPMCACGNLPKRDKGTQVQKDVCRLPGDPALVRRGPDR
jgi:hypothetical protein